MRRVLLPFAVGSFCLLAFVNAPADTVTYVSQTRIVDASSFASDSQTSDSDAENHTAPDFGPFSEAASALVILGGAIGSGTGWQVSTLEPHRIHAEGSHSANGEGWEEEGFGSGDGESRFVVTFDVAGSCGYVLSGFLEHFDSGFTSLNLSGPGGTVHGLSPGSNEQIFVSEQGTLTAGQYTLSILSSGSAFGDPFFFDYASGAYDIDLIFDGAVAAPEVSSAPALSAAPNPFRASTRFTFGATRGAPVDVRVFDVSGRLVTHLVEGRGATGTIEWDGRDAAGTTVPAGVYFVRMDAKGRSETLKITRAR